MIDTDLAEFQRVFKQLLNAEKSEPVATPIKAEALFSALDLNLTEEGLEDEELYEALEQVVMNTPRTATNLFFNQLFGGRHSKAVLGDLMAVMLNSSMYTYKVAGPMVGVEKEILRNVCSLIGYGNNADGTLAPGGSMSNFMAMVMARDHYKRSIRQEGVQDKMIVYTSATSHYSIGKNASLMGVGRAQVRAIETNSRGLMSAAALEAQIALDKAEGLHPFFVNATAGTTVLGAFDPVDQIANVCEKHNLWLHVDGAYCGAVIFSEKYKHLVKGLERSNSFSLNAHKMLGTPLTCSIIVTQERKHLVESFSSEASYLYQTDGDEFNLGKTSLQCGRRNDALKLWTLWKSVGTRGLAAMVDHQFHLADVARDYVRNNPDYTFYSFDDSISVCFNYKGISPQQLCTALYEEAAIMVGYGSFNDEDFIRFITINATNGDADILNFFKRLEEFVAENESTLLLQENAVSN